METIIGNLSDSIGTSILYSLLQGLFVYFLLRTIFLIFTNLKAVHKYNLALSAFAAVSLWFMVTLATHLYQQTWLYYPAKKVSDHFNFDSALASLRELPVSYYDVYTFSFKPYLPYLSIFYTAGLLLQFTLIAYRHKQLSRLKQTLITDTSLNEQIERLSARLGFSKKIRAGISKRAIVPCVAGHFKPILFLPASIYTGLSAEQIESILLHELAHIKRNDYLINYIQQVFTGLLFFNPFVILLNRTIAAERENCCDDVVIGITEQPLTYAQALLNLQQAAQPIRLTLAAKSKGFLLLNRIQRIMKTEKPVSNFKPLILSIILLVGGMVSIAWFKPQLKEGKITVRVKKQLSDHQPQQDIVVLHENRIVRTSKKKISAHLLISSDTSRFRDKEMERILDEMDKYSAKRDKYWDSSVYRDLNTNLAEKIELLYKHYNHPQLKEKVQQIPADQYLLADSIDAWAAHMKLIAQSDDFKNTEASILKKYGISKGIDGYTKSQQWRKYKDEWEQTKKTKYKNEIDALDKIINQMHSKEITERDISRAKSDSIHAVFDTPEITLLKGEIKALQSQVRAYNNSSELKQIDEAYRRLHDTLNVYIKTPEFQQRIQAWIKTHPDQPDFTKWVR
ncbi:M56 family metallopeptidase [Mucilaginibacter sp. CSA2-8R]|uniref:M56 family metallopeptidase n=1 Tax=Mucilaginibacter sp. CSA2-8R TaxID=3141542 RepID=UPI00315D7BB2